MSEATLLVTGASGHLGRRVLELLLEAGETRIVAATRTPDKLADFAARGVTVRHADFEDLASLESAFAGVDRLLLISTDAVGSGDRRLKQHQNAVRAADTAGVRQVIYTSIICPTETPVTLAPDHAGTEAALEASSMGWTSLRNNIYADELIRSINRAVESGKWISAAGDGRCAYIMREDCAQAAAAALASSFEGRRTLDITGPDAISQAELAQLASQLSGKPVDYLSIPLEASIQGMVNAGLPQSVAELIASFDAGIAQGIFSGVSPDYASLTGHPAMHIADFLTAAYRAQPSA